MILRDKLDELEGRLRKERTWVHWQTSSSVRVKSRDSNDIEFTYSPY